MQKLYKLLGRKTTLFCAIVIGAVIAVGLAGCDTSTNGGGDNSGQQQGGNNTGGDNTGGNNSGDNTGGNQTGGGTTTVPSTPTGVTATAQSSSSISVSWSAVSGATSYKIYYEIGSSSTKNLAGTASGTSYTHTGLTAGTTCYYYIKAVNSAGESGYSSYNSAASATTSSAAPSRPTSVSGNITFSSITVTFSFGSAVQNIVVEAWSRVSRSWKTLATLSGSATSYSISPYRDYIVSGNVVTGNGMDGPQGITDETDLVFVRVRGKNGSATGPAKSVAFDAFLKDVYTDLNTVYDN